MWLAPQQYQRNNGKAGPGVQQKSIVKRNELCLSERLAAESYQSYLANCIRKAKPSPGIPLNLSFRSRRDLKDK